MKTPANKGKKYNFILLFFTLLLCFSFAITSYFAWVSHVRFKETLVNQWNKQIESTLEISSINLTNYFTKFSQNLEYLTSNYRVQEWAYKGEMTDCDGIHCPLRNLFELHKNEVNALVLVDRTGKIVTRFTKAGLTVGEYEKCQLSASLFEEAAGNHARISDIFINKDGRPAITISMPVYYKDGLAGVVRWMIELSYIAKQFISPVRIGEEGYMSIMDSNGNVISHPNGHLTGKSIHAILDSLAWKNSDEFKGEKLTETVSFFTRIDGSGDEGFGSCIDFEYRKYSIAAFKKISVGNMQWVLVASMPYSEISAPVQKHAITTFGLAGAIIVIILILGIAFFNMQSKKAKLEVETKYLTEIARAAEELKRERSMRLTAMIDGQEKERQRISREIHDGLGQYLLAMKMKLENAVINRSQQENGSLAELNSLFIKTIEEVKRISDNLIPVILDEFGVTTALRNLCNDASKDSKIKVEFVSYGVPPNIDNKIQTYLYRIAQEGLSNIIRHSGAGEANIQLLGNVDQVNLIIQDDGCGFELNRTSNGNGLNNIRERAAILNGTVEITGGSGEGTTIAVKIPLK